MPQIKNANVTFNVEAFKGWTENEFVSFYKGKTNANLQEVWSQIEKYFANENPEKNSEPSKKLSKGNKRKRIDDDFVQESIVSETDH